MGRALAALLVCTALGVEARAKSTAADRIRGLGRSCQKKSDCKSRAQRCLFESDANGNDVKQGFCVLPCASFEEGTTKVVPGAPVDSKSAKAILKKRKTPPRCPPRYLCRSAGSGVPIDMCVKE